MWHGVDECVNRLFGLLESRSDSHRQFHAEHLSNFLPYKLYDPDSELFISDTHIGFLIETAPLIGNNESMQKELSNIFTQILPENTAIQTMLFADKNIGYILDNYIKSREVSSETMQQLAAKRAKYLSQLAIKSQLFPYVLRNFRCFMSVTINITQDLENMIHQVADIKKQIIATLSVVGIPSIVCNATDLINLISDIFNMQFESTSNTIKKWNRFDPINEQIIDHDTDFTLDEDLIRSKQGKTEIKTFSVSKYPPEWTLSNMAELIGDMFRDSRQIPFPFIIHYGVYIPKQSNQLSKISLKSTMVEKQLFSPIGKYIPDIEREHAELQYAQNCLAKGERLVQTYFGIVLFSPAGEMSSAEQILKTMFSSMSFKVESNIGIHLPALLYMLPMSWNAGAISVLSEFKKLRTTISIEASNLVPQQGEWKGTRTPAMVLGGRKGQVLTFCPFDNTAGNYNVTVVGRSGAGKSVFMQELMASTIGLGGRVFVLDVGRSFEKTCHMLEGQFIEFSKDRPICLNPFSSFDINNQDAVEDSLAMLKTVIQMMAAPIDGVNDKGAALLQLATDSAFKQYGNKTNITHIAEFLLNNDDTLSQDLGKMLYPYTTNGVYGKYFNGQSNVNLDKQLVVIELEELKEKKDLQSVVVQMMVINITSKMFLGDRKTPFNIVFDEA